MTVTSDRFAAHPSNQPAAPRLRLLAEPAEPTSCDDTLLITIPRTAPAEIQKVARQLIESLEQLLTSSAVQPVADTEPAQGGDVLESGVDRHSRVVTVNGEEVQLTHLEFELLAYFDAHRRRAVTRDQLLSAVWQQAPEFGSRTVDVHIRRLRRKLGSSFQLTTVRSFGYRFDGWSDEQ